MAELVAGSVAMVDHALRKLRDLWVVACAAPTFRADSLGEPPRDAAPVLSSAPRFDNRDQRSKHAFDMRINRVLWSRNEPERF